MCSTTTTDLARAPRAGLPSMRVYLGATARRYLLRRGLIPPDSTRRPCLSGARTCDRPSGGVLDERTRRRTAGIPGRGVLSGRVAVLLRRADAGCGPP